MHRHHGERLAVDSILKRGDGGVGAGNAGQGRVNGGAKPLVFSRVELDSRSADRQHPGDWLALLIADEGPGVADGIRDKLFQPFATFGKKKGTGLGLAVSRRFVEDHGGTLELLPGLPPPDHGARFLISLPLLPRAGPAAGV